MALDAERLAELIKQKVAENTSSLDPATQADQYGDAMLAGIAAAVVEHLTEDAEVVGGGIQ
jgi:NaMN:DMB phosphoribosyltransferase